MTQMTRAQYDEIVRAKGPQWANNWRAQNGIQVEGMQPVAYQEPAYDDEEELPPAAPQGALPSGMPTGAPSIPDLYSQQAALGGELSDFWANVRKDRKAQYEQATAELEKRRFGPSRAEQLFQLAAAIGKPTYDRSFGSIMSNVTPALAGIAQANRTAEEERSAAAQALRDKYLSGDQETAFNILQQKQKNLSALTPLAVAQARAQAGGDPYKGATWDPNLKTWVPRPGAGAPPVAVGTKMVGNQKRTIYSDGSFTVQLPNGVTARYGPDGRLING